MLVDEGFALIVTKRGVSDRILDIEDDLILLAISVETIKQDNVYHITMGAKTVHTKN